MFQNIKLFKEAESINKLSALMGPPHETFAEALSSVNEWWTKVAENTRKATLGYLILNTETLEVRAIAVAPTPIPPPPLQWSLR